MIPIIIGAFTALASSASTAAAVSISTNSLVTLGTAIVAGTTAGTYLTSKHSSNTGHYNGEKDSRIEVSNKYEPKLREQAYLFQKMLDSKHIAADKQDQLIKQYLELLKLQEASD